ncbi:MAG TPA: GNAT family protein [Micromonosporaceae bacterium]|jgi:ribosomal-protein-alanine N-acetyltransferase|nr:GNAT family protein [Micromonosporaceae bacterium]
MTAPGWPVVLRDGPVELRPYRHRDGRTWSQLRRTNEAWLSRWEPTTLGDWRDLNSPLAYRSLLRELRRTAREGTAMPFAIWLVEGGNSRMVGQLTIGNIVRRAFCSGHAGYWIDASVAGRGIMPTALALATDHAFTSGGMHRMEVNIRPENTASRRVVEKLGFREEALHVRYLHIDGAWRDHIGYALTAEEILSDGGLLNRWHRLRDGSQTR